MSSITSNSSLLNSRSLRVAPSLNLKTAPTLSTQVATGPSNVVLFLTNLRLLDLDLRKDWPDITPLTFSTKDAQQNQKKRIQCVEWALYQLFTIWDSEEARNVFSLIIDLSRAYADSDLTEASAVFSSTRTVAITQSSQCSFSMSRSGEEIWGLGQRHSLEEDNAG